MKNLYFLGCDKNGGVYHYKQADGKLVFCEKTPLDRPMFSVIENNTMYVLLRDPLGNGISYCEKFDILPSGGLEKTGKGLPTKGVVACHLCIDGENVYAVNYLSGNVVKLPKGTVDQHNGKGVNLPRQDAPHTHFVCLTPDKKYVCVTDLGLDKIFVYDKDLNYINSFSVPSGHGCRHLAFNESGEICYCVNELKSTVTVFRYSDGNFNRLESYSALPENFSGENLSAAIRVDKGYLYVSNRGHNSITCFKIKGEELEYIKSTDCGGKSPRDFDITDDIMYVTNEQSDNVTVFSVQNGQLIKKDEELKIPSPLCVAVK